MQGPQDEDSIFDDDFEEKEVEINKEPKRKEKSKETKEMSKEIEKLKDMLKRSQGIEDYMLDIEGLCPFPDVQLPPKFKMPKMDSFDGTGNPKNHLKQYVLAMKPLGLTKEQIILCFPRTLSGVALQWYLSLENAKMNDWNKMTEAFAQQYEYCCANLYQSLKTFVDLYDVGIQVEDAINSGLIEKSNAKPQKKFGVAYSSNSGNNGGKTSEVNVVNVQREFSIGNDFIPSS